MKKKKSSEWKARLNLDASLIRGSVFHYSPNWLGDGFWMIHRQHVQNPDVLSPVLDKHDPKSDRFTRTQLDMQKAASKVFGHEFTRGTAHLDTEIEKWFVSEKGDKWYSLEVSPWMLRAHGDSDLWRMIRCPKTATEKCMPLLITPTVDEVLCRILTSVPGLGPRLSIRTKLQTHGDRGQGRICCMYDAYGSPMLAFGSQLLPFEETDRLFDVVELEGRVRASGVLLDSTSSKESERSTRKGRSSTKERAWLDRLGKERLLTASYRAISGRIK